MLNIRTLPITGINLTVTHLGGDGFNRGIKGANYGIRIQGAADNNNADIDSQDFAGHEVQVQLGNSANSGTYDYGPVGGDTDLAAFRSIMSRLNNNMRNMTFPKAYNLQLGFRKGNEGNAGEITIEDYRAIYIEQPERSASKLTFDNIAGIWLDPQISVDATNNYGIVLNGDGAGSNILFGAGRDVNIYFDSEDLIINSRNITANDEVHFTNFDGVKIDGFLQLTQKAGTAIDGDLWNDSTQEALQTYVSGIEQTLTGVIFTQTADQTIANTTTETTLFSTGVGTLTLPANFWVVGKTIRMEIHGDFADTGNPTAEIQVYYGTTSLIDSGAITLSGLAGTEEWETHVIITCRSIGETGTLETIIDWEYETSVGSSAIERLDVAGTLTEVNTTASGALDITFQWGTAHEDNTLVSEVGLVEVLN